MEQASDEFADPAGADDEPSVTEGGDGDARPRWSRLVWAGVLGVLVLATAGVLHARASGARTPEAAVLEYVSLIEAGDVEAASDLVPVPASVETIGGINVHRLAPVELLSNASYQDNPGIREVSVAAADVDLPVEVGEVAEVVVSYFVQDDPGSVLLRVERLEDEFPALPAWKVIDSMAVPSAVVAGTYGLGEVLIDAVPVSPLPDYPAPQEVPVQVETMLYPGVYEATFESGPYLTAPSRQLAVLTPGPPVQAGKSVYLEQLMVEPTALVNDLIQAEAVEFLTACEVAPTTVDLATCPKFYRERPTDSRVSGTLMGEQVATSIDGNSAPLVTGTVTGSLVVLTPDGARNDYFTITVTVTFDSNQPATSVSASATRKPEQHDTDR